MNFREDVMGSTASQQRGVSIKAGDRFLRGAELVDVTKAEGGSIDWAVVSTGETLSGPRRAFTGRALVRIPAPPSDGAPTPLDAIWTIANAKQLSQPERLQLLAQLFPASLTGGDDGLTPEDSAEVQAWVAALRANTNPTRTA